MSVEDLNQYRAIVKNMPCPEKACGFISGKKEIISWPQRDVFQLINDTNALYGDINTIVPEIPNEVIVAATINNSANLYHMACHCYLYDEVI